ncbi:DEKNAAC103598 [Brettanomyces naardenensis]|uniref:Alkaline phosphatase n=1 Tax=Brettanomyces naardenensis TaxID=13370 RepID=A0A448YND4_BRENA|nr:DEKNAAC103598 [Brettanomyces naardenensis]
MRRDYRSLPSEDPDGDSPRTPSPENLIELSPTPEEMSTEGDSPVAASPLPPKRSRVSLSRKRKLAIHAGILLLIIILYCCTRLAAAGDVSEKRFSTPYSSAKIPSGKKNIIMMVTDGTGPASINMARSYKQHHYDLSYDDVLEIDKHFIGSSRTRSNSSLITDSAAGATVFSCGLKTYNGAIGVDPLKNPRGTILEALKLKGYKTGLVVTTSITDATPAAFNSHVDYRFMQSLIANQQLGFNTTLGLVTDLMIGGGRCFYLPGDSPGGCRDDNWNLVEEAKQLGFNVALNRKEFDSWQYGKNVSLPMLSLLAGYNIPYDIDRDDSKYPSLEEEVITALTALSDATKDSDEGFFLLVEGSRIDHAGHSNDPAAQVREVLAYDKAFKAVIDFADSTDVPTYIVSTSDHETGGLDVGRQITAGYPEYLWRPDALENATHSGEYLLSELHGFSSLELDPLTQFIEKEIFESGLGIVDYSATDVKKVVKLKDTSVVQDYLNNMVSERAQVGWSTHGHTAVDVNIYGHANTEEGTQLLLKYLLGNHENVDIGKFWQILTDSDLDKVTELLKGTPHKPKAEEMVKAENVEDMSHGFVYHGLGAVDMPTSDEE